MKIFLLVLVFFISGCARVTVPVKHSLPELPAVLAERCPDLLKLKENEEKLSELIKTVVGNYILYHECGSRHELLVKWYKEQKQIHDSVHNKK